MVNDMLTVGMHHTDDLDHVRQSSEYPKVTCNPSIAPALPPFNKNTCAYQR
jgi:hypothetical protein